jgi:geranylgeranyl diphosphate synthase type II
MHTIAALKQRVDEAISKVAPESEPADLYEPIRYMLALEGKRMRPVLTLTGCDLFGGDLDLALKPALGIEVFHNFTLMHDDIMDNAPLRRSKATVHTKWNSSVAILSGDTMFVKSCQLVSQSPDTCLRQVMELFYKTAIEVCEGQQLDMDFESRQLVSPAEYIHMISNKTAVLLAAALKTGALIGGASPADADHLYEFGRCIGIAFQLKDDLLDVYGDADKFGKLPGGDIIANKKTMLLIKALELANAEERRELDRWLKGNGHDPLQKVTAVTGIFDRLGVKLIAEKEMDSYFEQSLNHLQAIDVPESRKEILREFAEKLMVRET